MARRILHQGLRSEYLLPPLHPREGFRRGIIKEVGVIPAASPEFSLIGSAGPSSPLVSPSFSPPSSSFSLSSFQSLRPPLGSVSSSELCTCSSSAPVVSSSELVSRLWLRPWLTRPPPRQRGGSGTGRRRRLRAPSLRMVTTRGEGSSTVSMDNGEAG
jgi:hypothetical protein